jgi:hypothetical protein
MKWTKNAVYAAMAAEHHLQMHISDLFEQWWLENIWKGEYSLESINAYHAPQVKANNGSPLRYELDAQAREWVILYDGEEYRFPKNWVFEDLDEEPDVKPLWHCDYYDGPLSGMALLDGRMVWFTCHKWGAYDDEELCPDYSLRTYALIELTEEEIAEEVRRHENFRRCVGHHCDYGENYAPYRCKDKELQDQFYAKAKPINRNYKDREPIMIVSDVQLFSY